MAKAACLAIALLITALAPAYGLMVSQDRGVPKEEKKPSRDQFYTVNPTCGEGGDKRHATDIIVNHANSKPANTTVFPEWIQRFCPHVVDHFTDFPYFPGKHASPLPVFTTRSAAHSVCEIQFAVHIAKALGFEIGLHAGSALGAVLHGGPIPWDDDVDMLIPHTKRDQFLELCNQVGEVHPGVRVECKDGFNAIKFSVVTSDSTVTWPSPYSWFDPRPKGDWHWHWPYLDVFTFDVKDGYVRELGPSGNTKEWSVPKSWYYPTKSLYFGGVLVSAPQDKVVTERYNLDKCVLATYDHETGRNSVTRKGILGSNAMNHAVSWVFPPEAAEWLASKVSLGLFLDCCRLAARFPFGYNNSVLSDGTTRRDMDQLVSRAQHGARTFDRIFAPMLAEAEAGSTESKKKTGAL